MNWFEAMVLGPTQGLPEFFTCNMISLGVQFIITAVLLSMTLVIKPKERLIVFVDSLIIGIAQAIAGYFAFKWMINLVKRGNLLLFAVYCIIVWIFSILLGLHVF